jgi:hypothetical protein
MKFNLPYTDRQRAMVTNPSRLLWIGCGTKTGKTFGLLGWLLEGMLSGEPCCYVGPWYFRCRAAFDLCKDIVQPHMRSRQVAANESRIKFYCAGGGYLDFMSADEPNSLFGGNYARLVVDEASRCPAAIYPAALTTISGVADARIRLAFNVELGNKNWAIRNLLRVQALSKEEQERTSESFLTFPSGGDGLVAPDVIALLRNQMPESLWRALYLAEIPTSDVSLFRNIDRVFCGQEMERAQ